MTTKTPRNIDLKEDQIWAYNRINRYTQMQTTHTREILYIIDDTIVFDEGHGFQVGVLASDFILWILQSSATLVIRKCG